MSQPIRFHRVAYDSVPENGWRKGHVYFIYKTDGTGEIKVCKDDNNTLETYTPTVTQQSASLPLNARTTGSWDGYVMTPVANSSNSVSSLDKCDMVYLTGSSTINADGSTDFAFNVYGDIKLKIGDGGDLTSLKDTLSGLETLLASI